MFATRSVASFALALACVGSVVAGCGSGDPTSSSSSSAGDTYTLETALR